MVLGAMVNLTRGRGVYVYVYGRGALRLLSPGPGDVAFSKCVDS